MYELKVVRERRSGYGEKRRIINAGDVVQAFRERFEKADREEFIILLLDAKNILLGFNLVSVGSLTTSIVHPREVFKPAIIQNAASLILLHNHPSGDPYPSPEDLHITGRLKKIGEVVGIRIVDHVIIGNCGSFVSFMDDGYWTQCPEP